MLQKLRVRGFRCFTDLTLDPIGRVNLVAGRNNSGKTALLEAIFMQLAPNNPELALRIHIMRGLERVRLESEDVWGWLFASRHLDQEITIEGQLDSGGIRTLTLSLGPKVINRSPSSTERATGVSSQQASYTTTPGPVPLVLRWQDGSSTPVESQAVITPDGIEFTKGSEHRFPLGVFCTTHNRFPNEDAERFSRLEAAGRQDEVVEPLRMLEPRLKRLAVLLPGGSALIHGDIGIGELVPLLLMGEGIVRLLSLLLAIAHAEGGTVLIDEVENGLHHSVLNRVWQAIGMAAERANVQVFATTHSFECIAAAHSSFLGSPDGTFQFFRLDRSELGIVAKTFDREALSAALATGLEVR